MKYMAYRRMVGVCFTEEEAKAEAEEQMVCININLNFWYNEDDDVQKIFQ